MASRYVDLMAGDSGGDSDDDEDELDEAGFEDFEDADLEPENDHSFPVQFSADEEIDNTFEALRQRAEDRAHHHVDLSEGDAVVGPAVDALTRQIELPDINDSQIFSVQVKRGMESNIVIRLFNKSNSKNYGEIRSIFCVPKSKGRVYVEACSYNAVRSLCSQMNFVYRSSIFSVPISERVALMTPGEMKPLLKEGDLAKVRNGLYREDIGEVVDTRGANEKRVVVKLMSRQMLPYDLKRKRSRPEPFVLDRERILHLQTLDQNQDAQSRILKFEDRGIRGFTLNGKNYTQDGFLLLDVRTDRVERVKRKNSLGSPVELLVSSSLSSSAEISEILETDESLESPIRPGVPVLITGGPSRGVRGHVVTLTSRRSAMVLLDATRSSPGKQTPIDVQVEESLQNLMRIFEIGDRVEVKAGVFRGRTGIVSAKVGERKLHIVNPQDLKELIIDAAFVDDHALSISNLVKGKICEDSFVRVSQRAIVCRGKHAGKTGNILFVGDSCVRLIEDVTNIEITVAIHNVRPHYDDPNALESKKRGTSPLQDRRSNAHEPIAPLKDGIHENGTCAIDHLKEGFEGQVVYAWRGPLKGKLGIVVQISGSLARLSIESAMKCEGILDIPTDCLIAKCACVLAPGVDVPWTKEDRANVPMLFDMMRESRSDFTLLTNKTGNGGVPAGDEPDVSPFHVCPNPKGEGMWLFKKAIAQHRKEFDLIVKIESHRDVLISGMREGRVLADPSPMQHPIPASVAPNVLVKFTDSKHQVQVESMSVAALRTTSRMRERELHIIIRGKHVGTLVMHMKTVGAKIRVHAVGEARRSAFYVEKKNLCIAEYHTSGA